MLRRLPFLVVFALAACGRADAPDAAAKTAASLISAAARDDRVTLEAAIDRPAVRDDLRRQMVEVGQAKGLDVDGGPSDFALDRMVGPTSITRAAARESLAREPTAAQVAPLLKTMSRKRVCLADVTDHDRCLLTFAKAKDGWRLVGMAAVGLTVPAAGD